MSDIILLNRYIFFSLPLYLCLLLFVGSLLVSCVAYVMIAHVYVI